MKLGFKTMTSVAALCAALAMPAFAEDFSGQTLEDVRSFYTERSGDYLKVELEIGATQVKVEAVTKEGVKTETIYAIDENGVLTFLSEDDSSYDDEEGDDDSDEDEDEDEDDDDDSEDDSDDGEDDDSDDSLDDSVDDMSDDSIDN